MLYFLVNAVDNLIRESNASTVGSCTSKFQIREIQILGVLFHLACAHTTHSPPALPS